MRTVNVDFADPPKPSRLLMALTLAIGIAAVVFGALGWRESAETRRLHEQSTARAALVSAQAQQAIAAQAAAARSVPAPYEADAWAALNQQQFPLNAVMTAIESVAVIGVRVISVDIAPGDATVRLQVDFSDYETLMKYMQELNAGEPAERWVLVNAQINNGGIAGRPTANLLSTWRQEHNAASGR